MITRSTHHRSISGPLSGDLVTLFAVLVLAGCSNDGSDGDGNGNEPPADVTLVPESVDAVASLVPVENRSALDLAALAEVSSIDSSVGLESMSTNATSPTLILSQWFTNEQDQANLRYSAYDLDSGNFVMLDDATSSSAISRDGNAIAWLDPDSCDLWYRSLNPAADPVRINDILREFACPRVPSLSADGSTVWFDQAVGSYSDNGVLRFESFSSAEYAVAIVRPDMQELVELASSLQPLGDAELDALLRFLGHEVSSSQDGRRLVFKTYFLPTPLSDNGVHEYVIGSLLVDTSSGEITLLNRNRYNRFYSDKVGPSVQDEATISGDGNIVWYLESDGMTTDDEIAPSLLQRRDLTTGQVTTIKLPGFKDSLFSSTDGNELLFQLDGEVVVYRHDAEDLLHTSTALRFCIDPADASTCEFDESSYYVLNDPASISDDGSAVLIRILSQRPDIETPQNKQELMLLDVTSGVLQRLAPDQDVLFTAMTPSADRIAFLTEWSDEGEYLGEDRVVIVSRE